MSSSLVALSTGYCAVSAAFEDFLSRLSCIRETITGALDEHKEYKKTMEARATLCATNSEKVVELNLGGTVFKTTEATLLSEKDTFFWAMLNSGHWEPNKEGQYFIDRSPDTFGHILEYLRSGRLDTRHLPERQKEMLKTDIDFFQIHSLIKPPGRMVWQQPTAAIAHSVKVVDDGNTMVVLRTILGHHCACFPTIGSDTNEDRRWVITAKSGQPQGATTTSSKSSLWYGTIGICSKETGDGGHYIGIGVHSGKVYNVGTEIPFVHWQENATTRTVEFRLTATQLTIFAMGHSKSLTLPRGNTWFPAAGWGACAGQTFTIH
eukprot:TRINITY_DN68078_c3_g2_i1.p1 TRINITY_DN68078_c3_g2~~TRINITY_DN68078_c3_g2_i1.p1  ORF type:complete len:321 (-),score=22.72 TRINITY_DN68078_c3_g2_i1:46-1008(-)